MRNQDDRHFALVTQGVEAVQDFTPLVRGDDRALAIGKVFGVMAGFDFLPDQVLQPVGAVDDDRAEVMLFAVERANGLHHIAGRTRQREMINLERAQAVLSQNEDRVGRTGGEGGLADPLHAIEHDAGGGDGFGLADGFEVKGHRR